MLIIGINVVRKRSSRNIRNVNVPGLLRRPVVDSARKSSGDADRIIQVHIDKSRVQPDFRRSVKIDFEMGFHKTGIVQKIPGLQNLVCDNAGKVYRMNRIPGPRHDTKAVERDLVERDFVAGIDESRIHDNAASLNRTHQGHLGPIVDFVRGINLHIRRHRYGKGRRLS